MPREFRRSRFTIRSTVILADNNIFRADGDCRWLVALHMQNAISDKKEKKDALRPFFVGASNVGCLGILGKFFLTANGRHLLCKTKNIAPLSANFRPLFPTKKDALRPFLLERVTGIEPAASAWEAEVLPLDYTRMPLLYAFFLSLSREKSQKVSLDRFA